MLHRLSITDFALLQRAEVEFGPGLNVITGETGAGKSLLVGALLFLAGGKPALGLIRDGARSATVEGEFSVASGDRIFIRRILSADGKSRAYVDDTPTGQKELSQLVTGLLDITSQRAFSRLLDSSQHLDMLDAYAGLGPQREELASFAAEYHKLDRKVTTLQRKIAEFKQKCEFLRHQLAEIDAVNPVEGEDLDLLNELHRLEHFDELRTLGNRMLELLSNDKDAVENRLVEAAHLMGKVAVFDNTLGELSGELESTRLTLREVSRRIAERCRSDNQQHERLEKLRERQHTLGALIRRHGGSLQSVLEKAEKLREELSGGTGAESELESITLDLEKLLKRWQKLASEVSEIRKNSAQRLATDVTMALSELGIGKPQFEVDLVRSEDRDGLFETEGKRFKLTERGVEDVEFQFSANPGMPVKPIATVASGGELSRVMLALKEVLPLQSAEASILFDEIDTGVSGRVARLVGYKLRQLSGNRQFLVITHLPQIASLANRHYRVQKLSDLSGTHTLIKELKSEERVDEIALMISGSGLTESARLQARTLLSEAETRI